MTMRGTTCWLGLILAVALVAAACGGDDDAAEPAAEPAPVADSDDGDGDQEPAPEQPTGPACGLANGEAATGEPIAVGGIVGETGPDDFSSAADAAGAYFDCVNANGGINGRPIQYIVEDDQWNPEVAAQAAARLVQDEGVVALVGGASFVECGVNADLYASEQVISLLGVGVIRECFNSANIAAVNQGPRLSSLQIAQYVASELGATSFVCIAPNIPSLGDWVCDGVQEWAESEGYTSVSQLVDPALPDATAVALDALFEGADSIIVALPAGAAVPVPRCSRATRCRERLHLDGPDLAV